MIKNYKIFIILFSGFFSPVAAATMNSKFVAVGTKQDINYSKRLWDTMVENRIEGKNRKNSKLFFGGAKPHGEILELSYQDLTIDNHTGFIVVKRNYGEAGDKTTVENVNKNRAKYLDSITVMFERESGYDEDNQNWFWVKYNANGSLFNKKIENKNIKLAGRLLKGKNSDDNMGCIYCHSSAGGGDYIFYPEVKKP